ncbi:class I SAM-dependent methyltransferase [uncultured Methanoregula sp.]|uniref:class I SAM-dependent DNA methyltransferase n=1 Tax=uncultured Methanoregula sp. TaxID=1005933 RepID=UPI002AAB0B56|nr:class I SAM-dependent methyltransferase [uncultured Methanoregula sp.]
MTGGKRDFDTVAKTWDENPGRVKLSADVALAITDTIPLSPEMDVLDFGCGTGLLTLRLRPVIHRICGIDSSEGMLAILEEKIRQGNLPNVTARHIDLDRGDQIQGRYHLVVSSMTLHHVQMIQPLLEQFFKILHPGGWLCVADLDPDGGEFHEDPAGVFHQGFEREFLKKAFRDAGFEQVHARRAATMTKPAADGRSRSFTISLISGRKIS